MRSILTACTLLALPLAQRGGAQEGPPTIQLEVGEERPLTGFRPICDDPAIASISAQGKGTIKGLKAGATLCSVSVGSPLGLRRVYRVVVVPPPGGGMGTPGRGPTG